ncbi:321_t:CDS:2, partial [Gigaspora margarita]
VTSTFKILCIIMPEELHLLKRDENNLRTQAKEHKCQKKNEYTYNTLETFLSASNIFEEPWQILEKLQKLLHEFQNTILNDYSSTLCACCSILMMNHQINWIDYKDSEEYTLPIVFENIEIVTRINNRNKKKVAVCSSCKSEKNHKYPPILYTVPDENNVVPIIYQKYLSPIYMNFVPNNNFFVEIHDEDYRYQRLIAGFLQTNNS